MFCTQPTHQLSYWCDFTHYFRMSEIWDSKGLTRSRDVKMVAWRRAILPSYISKVQNTQNGTDALRQDGGSILLEESSRAFRKTQARWSERTRRARGYRFQKSKSQSKLDTKSDVLFDFPYFLPRIPSRSTILLSSVLLYFRLLSQLSGLRV